MIEIKMGLAPFSHTPGICALIPGTFYEAEIFPALVRIYSLETYQRVLVKEFPIKITGPQKEFTVFQDLMRGVISVSSSQMRYHILPNAELSFEKKSGLVSNLSSERLSLGSHKAQDFEMIKRRGDFKEIFPLWHRIALSIPKLPARVSHEGMFSLIDEIDDVIKAGRPEKILFAFEKLFRAGFRGMFVPRLNDDEHQGIVLNHTLTETPLHLLAETGALITSLFVQSDQETLKILPALPPEFFAGKYLNYQTSFARVHFEWSKKTIRRVVIEALADQPLCLAFSSELKSYRLSLGLKGRDEKKSVHDKLAIKSGSIYVLDRFER